MLFACLFLCKYIHSIHYKPRTHKECSKYDACLYTCNFIFEFRTLHNEPSAHVLHKCFRDRGYACLHSAHLGTPQGQHVSGQPLQGEAGAVQQQHDVRHAPLLILQETPGRGPCAQGVQPSRKEYTHTHTYIHIHNE